MTATRMCAATCAVMLMGSACKSPPADAPPAKTPPAAATPVSAPAAPVAAAPAARPKKAKKLWMVPHPSEIVEVVRSMGLAGKTGALVPSPAGVAPSGGNVGAFQTGVLIADLVLSLDGAPNAEVAARLDGIRKGLTALGVADAQAAEMDKVTKRITSGKTSPEELAAELDAFQSRLMDEDGQYNTADALVGIQAGAWVRAVNVVATLLIQTGKAAEGAHLFGQPALVDYFITYVTKALEGGTKDKALEATLPLLAQLKKTAAKEPLTAEDVTTVQTNTAAILAQFNVAGAKP